MYDKQKPQWTMTVTVYHLPNFNHAVELVTETRGAPRRYTHDTVGTWKGVGIPNDVLQDVAMSVKWVLEEHLITRYGVAANLFDAPVPEGETP